MIEHDEQVGLFKTVGKELRKKTEAYAIGGTALMFYGIKERTKDIDLVFTDGNARRRFAEMLRQKLWYENALRNIKMVVKNYERMEDKPLRLECHGRPNFDLFLNCLGALKFSKSMQERAIQRHDFGNFYLCIPAIEDVLLLKSMTERLTDREDAAIVIKNMKIRKEVLFGEAKKQHAETTLKEFLTEVEEQFGAKLL